MCWKNMSAIIVMCIRHVLPHAWFVCASKQARLASKAGKQGWLLKLASKAGTVLIQHVPKLAFVDFDVHDSLHFLSAFLHGF